MRLPFATAWRRLGTLLPDHPELEDEFRRLYWGRGPWLFAGGVLLTSLAYVGFWLLDAAMGSFTLFGGVQTVRVMVVLGMVALAALALRHQGFVVRHYVVLLNVVYGGMVQGTAYVAFASRSAGHPAEMFWALNASMMTATVVAFGTSRLPSWNTLLLTSAGVVSALLYAATSLHQHTYLGRLAVHLVVGQVVCLLLAQSLERTERNRFLATKELERSTRELREMELAKQAAERADAAKAVFLASMSHEIRTPLHGVLEILRMVARRVHQDDQRLLQVAEQSGRELLGILNGILDYSSASRGKLAMESEPVDLVDLLQRVAALHTASAHIKGVELRVRSLIPAEARWVLASRVRLLEIANNLVSNAIKFTDQGHVDIEVRAEPADGQTRVTLRVADTGVGIAEEDKSKLFIPFWQADQGLNRRRGGTGLGLALTREIVSMLGGDIRIESLQGVGTTVSVTMALEALAQDRDGFQSVGSAPAQPVEHAAMGIASEGESETPRARLTSERVAGVSILLAEDNALNASIARALLEELGMAVDVACDGAEAVAMVRASTYDLVLMDCQMPVVDGLAATRMIRQAEAAHGSARQLPIIAWSAHPLGADRARCIEAGMNDCLSKPLEPSSLEEKLARWLPRWRPEVVTSSAPSFEI